MKNLLFLLSATALLASCNQDILVDNPQPKPEAPRHIGFETFVDKATRATGTNSTALNDFYPTFNVYGWKFVGNDVTCVFENIPVEYFAADTEGTVVYKNDNQKPSDEWTFAANSWYYENIRYWDKMASKYQYSAFTPTPAGVSFNCTSDGIIEIGTETNPVTVDSKNLMSTPSTSLAYTGFEKDYMTAQAIAEPSIDAAAMSAPVSLNFKHLQAKLNIRIKLDASMKTAQDIKVTQIDVHNLNDKGYYTNAEDENGNEAGVSGWTVGTASDTYIPSVTNDYLINNANEEEGIISYHNHYVLEQLIIPQTITKSEPQTPETTEETGNNTDTEDTNDEGTDNEGGEGTEDGNEEPTPSVVPLPVSLSEYSVACVYVEYTIGSEVFKSFTPLSNIFSNEATYNFEGGKQYTLNITIGPKPIKFTAEVREWKEGNTPNLPMD